MGRLAAPTLSFAEEVVSMGYVTVDGLIQFVIMLVDVVTLIILLVKRK